MVPPSSLITCKLQHLTVCRVVYLAFLPLSPVLCCMNEQAAKLCTCTEMHIVAFDIDRMHGRFNLAPGETHFGVLLDYLSETEVSSS